MPAVQIALRALVPRYDRPEDILRELNAALYETIQSASYVTLFYGTLDAGSSRIRYTNAGHLPAMLIRAETGEARWLAAGGPPAGLLPSVVYETEELPLDAGDVLLLYTDGVTEAESSDGEQFGAERLASLVRAYRGASSAEIVEAVRDAVQEFHEGRPLDDDLTLIAVKVPHQDQRDGGEV
jgi:sigma-B regulation protein RsbU (phosphoserine phosphatase)